MAVDADATDGKLSPPIPDLTRADSRDGGVDPETRPHIGDVVANWGVRTVALIPLGMLLAVAACAGWVGYGTYQGYQARQQNDEFVQVARQGALNLTTIDFTHAETDVQRILDGATGSFRADFQSRSVAFIDVVKQAQSKSDGTIVDAALESVHGDEAQVLVAVDVNTTVAGTSEPQPRAWRMRVTVQELPDGAKVSNVEFVT